MKLVYERKRNFLIFATRHIHHLADKFDIPHIEDSFYMRFLKIDKWNKCLKFSVLHGFLKFDFRIIHKFSTFYIAFINSTLKFSTFYIAFLHSTLNFPQFTFHFLHVQKIFHILHTTIVFHILHQRPTKLVPNFLLCCQTNYIL